MAYIGNFPTSPGFQAINFKQNNSVKQTSAASGRIIRLTNSTTIWSAILRFPPMSLAEFLPIQAFIARSQGGLNEFDVVMPTISQNSAGYTNNATVALITTTEAAAGTTSMEINSVLNDTKIFNPGDVIRFNNHSKVYMITDDAGVTTDGSGNATINFEPALITTVPVNDSAGDYHIVADVPFRMIMNNEIQEMGYRTDGLVNYELDVTEII